ncbi:LysM peptidoglycan-binding domain-containing protein [Sphingobium phenoxybenzoativorans]|uniref:LysM peptidoglycan-binding domain-containing protein n=1 Tax=Sphingobium phenoxybenzoativorans TaxID=1592790 RepID=UPI000871F153|nr:LysM domain-containing protein [Sphingobium phenoxybenzoativorans]
MNPTRRPFANALLAGIVLAALSACGKEPVRPAMIQPIRDPARLHDTIGLLQAGNLKKAEKALKAVIKKDPTDREAATLLRSMSEDPETFLGSQSFAYTVKAGDDYLSLAQRYLGDRYKFYALMRYNGRTGPTPLEPGATLRVPGTKPREAAAPPAREARPARSAGPAKPPTAAAPPKAATADPARAAKLRANGLSALNRGQVAQAVTALRAAAAAAPDDVLIRRDLARAERLYKTVKAKG